MAAGHGTGSVVITHLQIYMIAMVNQKDIVRKKHNSNVDQGIRALMQEHSRCSTLRGLLQLIAFPCGRYRALHILP
jgi:hypothetical protein